MITVPTGPGWKRITAIVAPALIAAGCAGTPDTPPTPPEKPVPAAEAEPTAPATLRDTSWLAVAILGRPASAAASSLSFGTAQVSGNAGCNNFQGAVELGSDNSLEFGALATTRKMCAPPVNGQETVFLESLSLARSWARSGEKLELLDESNAVLMQLDLQ